MNRPMLAMFGTLTLLTGPAVAAAQVAPAPEAEAGPAAYAPFQPMIGTSWRGTGTGDAGVEDIQRWDWAVGGHAVRVVHSVNGGAYAGETLIFRDRESGDYIFHYFTTGGFHTTGTMTPTGPGAFTIDETVHGADGIERLRSTAALGDDGVYRVRSSTQRDGGWVEVGGFDYREDPSATPAMPVVIADEGEAGTTDPQHQGSGTTGPPDWWIAHVDFMSRDGGVWETPNPAAASDPAAPDAFGLAWSAVDGGEGLVGRLYGVEEGRETTEFWTFRGFHHPGRRAVVLEQWSTGGAYGVGDVTSQESGRTVVDQTFWLADGRSWREGHRARESGDLHQTEVFDIGADGVWRRRSETLWRRTQAHAGSD